MPERLLYLEIAQPKKTGFDEKPRVNGSGFHLQVEFGEFLEGSLFFSSLVLVVVLESLRGEETKKHDRVLSGFDLLQHSDSAFAVAFGGSINIENESVAGVGRESEFLDFDVFVGLECFVNGGALIELEFL